MKVIGLLRCSTTGQIDSSIPVQRAAIQRWADANRHIIIEWLDEGGLSGFCLDVAQVRKKLPKLVQYIQAPPVDYDALVFYDQSRFGRFPPKVSFWLEAEAEAHGIHFINLQTPDLKKDDIGGDVTKVVQAHAAFEHSKILKIKSLEGAKQAVLKGKATIAEIHINVDHF